MKKIGAIFSFLLISIWAIAQNDDDILRYSSYQIGGSARSISLGGAVGSMGADFSSLAINPAGIGLYKKSEFSMSPTLYYSNLQSNMNGKTSTGVKDNFNLNNYGIVLVNDLMTDKGWKYFQFAIGVNRLNNYNHYNRIVNENPTTSLMNEYQIQAYGKAPSSLDPFSTDLAWYNYLLEDTIRTSDGVLAYTSPLTNGGARQELKNTTWGSSNELELIFGSSYSDIFYIGGGIGFPFVRYYEQYEYSETDIADTIANFDHFILNKSLETHGSGVNFKLGFIVRPTGFLRIGIAYQSPTWLHLSDIYSSKLTRFDDNGTSSAKSSPDGNFDYQITTPMKVTGSATFTLNKILMINADLDYLNYSNGRLSSGRTYDFYDENAVMRDKYKSALNVRAGAEIILSPLSFRAGVARYGNPYIDNINDGHYWVASAGIGYRDKILFLDFGASYSIKNEDYYLYDSRIIDPASLAYNDYRFTITAGIKF